MNLASKANGRKKYLIYELYRMGVTGDDQGRNTNNMSLPDLERLHITVLNRRVTSKVVQERV